MSSDANAIWTNGKSIRTGSWQYVWSKRQFYVCLDRGKEFSTGEDSPEWGDWKLVRDEAEKTNLRAEHTKQTESKKNARRMARYF